MVKNFRDDDEFRSMMTFEGHIAQDPNDPEETAFGDRANAHTPEDNPLFNDPRDNRKRDK